MAATNTTQYDKYASGRESQTINPVVDPNEWAGRVRIAWFEHTAGTDAVGDTINLVVLPAQARVIGMFYASDGAGAAGATIAIGDATDPDRLVSAFDIGTAAVAYAALTLRTPTTEEPAIGFGYVYTAETAIIATVAGDALNGDLMFGAILYVVD